MRTCPACESEVHKDAWICPYCDFIVDPSVLDDDDDADDSTPAWNATDDGAVAPEAMILGDVTVDPEDFQMLPGAGASKDGRTTTFLFYTTGATSRIVRPDAVPKLTESTITQQSPTTPYEDFILNLIDGVRTVRVIQRESGLSPQEVMISLLTLIDKRVVEIQGNHSKSTRASQPVESSLEPPEEPTVARGGPVSPAEDPTTNEMPVVTPSELVDEDQEEVTEHSLVEAPVFHPPADDVRTVARGPSDTTAPRRQDLIEPPSSRLRAPSFKPLVEEATGKILTNPVDPDMVEASVDVEGKEYAAFQAALAAHSAADAPADTMLDSDAEAIAYAAEEDDDPPMLADDYLLELEPGGMPAPQGRASSSLLRKVPDMVIPSEVDDPEAAEAQPVVRVMPQLGVEQPEKRRSSSAVRRKREMLARSVERARGKPSRVAQKRDEHPAPKPEANEPVAKPRQNSSIDPVRMTKAQTLYDQALKDKADGNIVSAKMNFKLALTFDPNNQMVRRAVEELNASGAEGNASRAKLLYDRATTAERLGSVDEAIELLEQALEESKEAPYYNRLGVLLATKKQQFSRAQEMINEALKRSPGNSTYEHNRGKVLQLAAKAEVEAREGGQKKKKGLLGFLGKKK